MNQKPPAPRFVKVKRTALLLLALAGSSLADEVVLKNGHRLEGIVREEGDKIVVEVDSGTVILERMQVARVIRGVSPLQEFNARLEGLKDPDAAACHALGVWAQEQGLDHKAREMFRRTLLADPGHEKAREALGYRKRDGRWMTEEEFMAALGFVKHRQEWMKREAADKILVQEAQVERERQTSAPRERIAELEAEVRRLETAAQEERERILAEEMKKP